jgi:hypothetical protein
MTTYRYRAYIMLQGPDEPLLEGTIRARDIMRALDRIIDQVHCLAGARPEAFWPARPGVGQERALRPVSVAVDVIGRDVRIVDHIRLVPPIPDCVTVGLQHDLQRYGQQGRCCCRCGLVEQPVRGGYMLYYRPAVQEVAQ